jgi:single-strand DNA-binding protein
MSVNKTILIGRVGKDPDVRTLQDGNIVANFTLATSERYKDRNGEVKESTEWHSITCWRGCADLANNYVRKGQLLYIEGKIHNRSYQDRDGVTRYKTEVIAETIDFLSKREDTEDKWTDRPMRKHGDAAAARASLAAKQQPQPAEDPGDDLPY